MNSGPCPLDFAMDNCGCRLERSWCCTRVWTVDSCFLLIEFNSVGMNCLLCTSLVSIVASFASFLIVSRGTSRPCKLLNAAWKLNWWRLREDEVLCTSPIYRRARSDTRTTVPRSQVERGGRSSTPWYSTDTGDRTMSGTLFCAALPVALFPSVVQLRNRECRFRGLVIVSGGELEA